MARQALPLVSDDQLTLADADAIQGRIPIGSTAWYQWLNEEQHRSFAFQSPHGTFTARRERQRHGWYWYAYRRDGSRLHKAYLGKADDLSLERLDAIATALAHTPVVRTGDKAGQPSAHARSEEQDLLLATKLHVPPLRVHLVPRPQLIEQLHQGMETALTLVSAPAGFGKSTLLAQWLAESGTPAAWLSLEPEDNELTRFLSYVIAALQMLRPRIGTTALSLLRTPQPASPETVLAVLSNDLLSSVTSDFALVLDDYHVITAAPLHHALAFLLEHLPPQMHLFIATRADPPLQLARLRAQGALTELRASTLRFALEEVSAFLHTVMGLDLPPADVAILERRTEGWAAGVQLAALSLRGRADVMAFLTGFSGGHRFVLDYLSEEVFSRQPPSVQAFLLSTCILDRLSGPLCDAVMEQGESQAMLEMLDKANLFVITLDDERHWYRYHHLFAEVLRSRLQQTHPLSIPALHLRASAWSEQQGLLTEAVHHALEAPDPERAARLIEQIGVPGGVGTGENISTMLGWLNALPDALVRTRPALCIHRAILLMFTHQLAATETWLQAAEQCVQVDMAAEEARVILGQAATIRGSLARFAGDLTRCVALSQQALSLLPKTETILRPIARLNATYSCFVNGDVTASTERLAVEAVAEVRAMRNLPAILRSLTTLARMQTLQGKLHQAVATYQEAARVAPEQVGTQALAGGPTYYFGLGDVLREWNDLDRAEKYLGQGMDLLRGTLSVEHDVITLGYITLARLQMARCEYAQARASLQSWAHLAHQHSFMPYLVARVAAVQAWVELARGNLPAASRWVLISGLSPDDVDLSYPREREYLTLARVRIWQADEAITAGFLQDILHLLEQLLQDAQSKARTGSALEILLVRALTMDVLGEQESALSTLERAVALAEPQGYVRLFADEGVPMTRLLAVLQAKQQGESTYLQTLLAACQKSAFVPDRTSDRMVIAATSRPEQPLIDPLSEREMEVLHLLALGASNADIAERLVVANSTAKYHVKNILAKLAATNRTQAVARARELGLL